MRHIERNMSATCAAATAPVIYRGRRNGADVFAFTNARYATAFRAHNAAYIVDPRAKPAKVMPQQSSERA
jgi:hypothetical protein